MAPVHRAASRPRVPIRGRNAKRVLFGTINIETGHRAFLARENQRVGDCQMLFETLRRRYRGPQNPFLPPPASRTDEAVPAEIHRL